MVFAEIQAAIIRWLEIKSTISDSTWIGITIFVRAFYFYQTFPTTITGNESIRGGSKVG